MNGTFIFSGTETRALKAVLSLPFCWAFHLSFLRSVFFLFCASYASLCCILEVVGCHHLSWDCSGQRPPQQPEADRGGPGQQRRRAGHCAGGRPGCAAERVVRAAAHCRGAGTRAVCAPALRRCVGRAGAGRARASGRVALLRFGRNTALFQFQAVT